MSDLHAYRASDELAAALREYHSQRFEFERSVAEWDREHEATKLMWAHSGFSTDRTPTGFTDSDRKSPPPKGLSRAQTRVELIPVRGRAGNEWRDVLTRFNAYPTIQPLWDRFGVPSHTWKAGPGFSSRITAVDYGDAGDDGVIVYAEGDLTVSTSDRNGDAQELSAHLAPISLSEFYRIKESLEAERSGVKS